MAYPTDGRIVSRRTVLAGAAAAVPAMILADGTPAAAGRAAHPTAGPSVRATFLDERYAWPTAAPDAAAPGVVLVLTAGGLPLTGRRVRFSISAFHAVDRSVWFTGPVQRKAVSRVGYLDLDTDAAGTVTLDRWLRRGAVPTKSTGAHPVLRAQLIGSETVLATVTLSVIEGEAR
ncbi:MAG: hypothetical protein HOV79_16240 [Hamadaea sp.]|nr:hypothetical protein [Hamadaea sp.]